MHRATGRRLTSLGSLRPYSGLTIKQGHLGTDNSTRGNRRGNRLQKGTHLVWRSVKAEGERSFAFSALI
eukprot:scaffold21950_cov107-Isochrysis_galbana.AAC.4